LVPLDVVREKVIHALAGALQQAKAKGQLKIPSVPTLSLDPPKRAEWGELASTIAMSLAPIEQRSPVDVAEIIVENLGQQEAIFDRIEIVRPGFLNMTVKRQLWLEALSEIERQGDAYGRADLGKGRRVLVEYVSANPTGPLHVGHGRGAAVGQAIVKLLASAGYDVVSEYYINDAGRQMKLLGASVFARYQALHGRQGNVPEDGYRGEYIEEVATRVRDQLGDSLLTLPADQAEERCRELAYHELLEKIRNDLRSFGIEIDSWFSEASLLSSGVVEQVLDDLRKQGLLFEEGGALWFRSSSFGDEKDRVVRKREGEYTYLATDIGYHRDKLLRGYDLLIDIWGADHHGYMPRMHAAVQAYGHPKDRLRIVLVQMVNLLRGGRKVEMSKRAGAFVTMREVLDEVGGDAAKFFFLMRRSDTHVDFDLDLAKQRSADNPVFYVQYAHARLASLFRVATERGIPVPKITDVDLRLLVHPDEFDLIRKLSAYPSVLQSAAAALEPHRLTFYLQELAALLHTFYYKHRILPPLPAVPAAREAEADAESEAASEGFVPVTARSKAQPESLTPGLTAARLVLMRQVQQVMRNALSILGISAPERM
jgi:arginyl-tRNA synthetase